MITHITVEDAAKLISRIAGTNEMQALTYIREAADRGEIQTADVAPVAHAQWKDDTCTNCGYGEFNRGIIRDIALTAERGWTRRIMNEHKQATKRVDAGRSTKIL